MSGERRPGISWGIGHVLDESGEMRCYGYPPTGLGPHLFSPDGEVCTPDEIMNHARDLKKYYEGVAHENE